MEHIRIAANLADGPSTTGFEDIHLINHSVPGLSLENIDLSCCFFSKPLSYPLLINAITGGTPEAARINRSLAALASRYGLAMAVGSQTAAIQDPGLCDTFTVVRKQNPQGIVLANVGATSPVQQALEAVEMIQADGLQLHFNVPQELAMSEGDRDFTKVLDNVVQLAEKCPVPIIAKEVGFGLSREAVHILYQAGIRYFDIGGKGGTNFAAIEDERSGLFNHEFDSWGIPTAISLAELLSLELNLTLIASGGMRSALDAVKALAMGAKLVGVAAPMLRILINHDEAALDEYLHGYLYRLQAGLLMTGSANLVELQQKPVVILGRTAQWLAARGIDANSWARR